MSRPRSGGFDPEIAANDPALFEQTLERHLHGVRRNREPDPLRAAAARDDRGVYPDHFAAKIDQRTAAVPRVDRGIRLQVIAETVDRDSAVLWS